jgi:hypothetical protein
MIFFSAPMPERFAIITALLLDRPTCIDCLCDKSGVKPARVNSILARIRRVMRVHRLPAGRCRACGEHRPVISIDAPADTPRARRKKRTAS